MKLRPVTFTAAAAIFRRCALAKLGRMLWISLKSENTILTVDQQQHQILHLRSKPWALIMDPNLESFYTHDLQCENRAHQSQALAHNKTL